MFLSYRQQMSAEIPVPILSICDSRVVFLYIVQQCMGVAIYCACALRVIDNFFSVVVTDRRSKRSSLLSNHTVNIPTIFADLPAAGVDLELLDVNRMCTEVEKTNFACSE